MLAALAALAAATVPVAPGFPAPPSGAVVFSREAGSDALGLAIVPKRRGVVLQASVVGEQGTGVAGLAVTFTVGSRTTRGVPCRAGCYRATVQTARRPASVSVDVRGTTTRVHWKVDVPATWPPHDAHALVARAAATWRSLDSVSFHERLASSAHDSVTSTWRIQAPDRIAYHVDGGPAAIVIGARRWDRTSDSSGWVESPQAGLEKTRAPRGGGGGGDELPGGPRRLEGLVFCSGNPRGGV